MKTLKTEVGIGIMRRGELKAFSSGESYSLRLGRECIGIPNRYLRSA